jgi:hypothetical protein
MQLSQYIPTEQLKQLKVPRYKRILKKYEDFILCVNIGDAEYIATEHPNLVYTLYLYIIKGKGKVGSIKGDKIEWKTLDVADGQLIDVSDYINSYGIMIAETDFYYIGFNTLNKNIKWDGRLISNEEKSLLSTTPNSYLVCLNGKVTINDKQFKRFDYASLDMGKEYKINIEENSALGLFSKLG